MTHQLLAPLHPDERALAVLFQANIDEEMLREIADADYGHMADECYIRLRQILQTGLAESYDFNLAEVLSLIHWGPRSGGLRGSWIQLFACTALVQLASRYPTYFWSEPDTLAPFVSCAIALGEPVARAGAAVLAGRYLRYPGDGEDSVFLAFAILLLAARVERGEDRGLWLKELATWVEEAEFRIRDDDYPFAPEWLLGLTHFNQFEGLWRHLVRLTLVEPASPHPRDADEALRRLGALMAESE